MRGNPAYKGWRKQWKRKREKKPGAAKALTIPLKVSLGGLAGTAAEHETRGASNLQAARRYLALAERVPACSVRVLHAMEAIRWAGSVLSEESWVGDARSGRARDEAMRVHDRASDIVKSCTKPGFSDGPYRWKR